MKFLYLKFASIVSATSLSTLYNSKGVPFVQVHLAHAIEPERTVQQVSMKLMSGQISRPSPRIPDLEPYQFRLMPSGTLSVLHSEYQAVNSTSVDRHMSVGHGSDFLNYFGNFLLLPATSHNSNQGALIVAPENPADYCVDRLIQHVPINVMHPHVHANIFMGSRELTTEPFLILPESEFVRIPRQIFLEIVQSIRPFVSLNSRPWSIPLSECTPEILARLPSLRIGIMDQNATLLYVLIEPVDYFHNNGISCEFRIRPSTNGESILGAPFLSAVGVHFTQSSIGFCDQI